MSYLFFCFLYTLLSVYLITLAHMHENSLFFVFVSPFTGDKKLYYELRHTLFSI